jgi:hypothetical protein
MVISRDLIDNSARSGLERSDFVLWPDADLPQRQLLGRLFGVQPTRYAQAWLTISDADENKSSDIFRASILPLHCDRPILEGGRHEAA